MDNRYYDNLIGELKTFFDENSFIEMEDGSFKNDKKSVLIKYDEQKQMYLLSLADVEDGNLTDYSEITSWLFDDSQTAKDASSVGLDFLNEIKKNMGIKSVRNASATNIELPSANKSGSMTIQGFTKKMLDLSPALKDDYKNFIAQYGDFLYLHFFGEFIVPIIKETLLTNSKKSVKKLYDVLSDSYVKGDKDTVNLVVALLCAASYQNEQINSNVLTMLSEDNHFSSSYTNFKTSFDKNKKLKQVLIK